MSTFGPALYALARQTSTSLDQITIALSLRSIGYLGGSLFALISSCLGNRFKVDPHVSLQLAIFAACVGLLLVPFVESLALLCLLLVPVGVAMGLIDVITNSLIFELHEEGNVERFVQGMHFCFGVGCVVFPFVVGAVLESRNGSVDLVFCLLCLIGLPLIFMIRFFPTPSKLNKEYYATGNYYTFEQPDELDTQILPSEQEPSLFARPRCELLVIWLCALFMFCEVYAETAASSFMGPFSVESQNILFTETEASSLVGVFWGAFTFSRLFAAFLSLFFSPAQLLGLFVILALSGLSILLVAGSANVSALWFGCIVYGLGIGPLFATCVTLTNLYMPVSPQVSAILIAACATGELVGNKLTVSFFEISPVYLWVACLVVLLIQVFCIGCIVRFGVLKQKMLAFESIELLAEESPSIPKPKVDPDFFLPYENPNYDWDEYDRLYS